MAQTRNEQTLEEVCLLYTSILCFADVLFTQGSIYVNEPQVMNLLGFGAFSMVCTLVVIYGKKHRALVLLASVAILGSYVTSILLSM